MHLTDASVSSGPPMAATFGWLNQGESIRIVCEGVGQDFQGDFAAQLGVGGLPDLAHAALPEEGGDVVVPEAGADGQGHGIRN